MVLREIPFYISGDPGNLFIYYFAAAVKVGHGRSRSVNAKKSSACFILTVSFSAQFRKI